MPEVPGVKPQSQKVAWVNPSSKVQGDRIGPLIGRESLIQVRVTHCRKSMHGGMTVQSLHALFQKCHGTCLRSICWRLRFSCAAFFINPDSCSQFSHSRLRLNYAPSGLHILQWLMIGNSLSRTLYGSTLTETRQKVKLESTYKRRMAFMSRKY